MRALGKRLDSAPTAVYWHVGSKDALVVMAADRIWSNLPLPDPQELGWHAVAEQMADDLYKALARHPWLVQAFGSYFLYGPGKARYDDHTLAVYEAGGFKGGRADQAAATMLTYVLGNSLGAAAQSSLVRKLEHDGDPEGRLLSSSRACEPGWGRPPPNTVPAQKGVLHSDCACCSTGWNRG
jgi:AcrR family transcriptional regulator